MKKIVAILMTLVLALSCVACASTESGTVESATSESVASEEASAEMVESNGLSGTVSFLCGETDEEQVAVVNEVIANFEADHPGCKIELVLSGMDDREQTILTELYAGGTVDIITVDMESLGAYVENGLLYPVDDLVSSIGEDDFFDGSRVIYEGHDYAMPYAGCSQMLYVRTDILEENGLEIPTTWDELLYVAEELTDKENDFYGMCLPAGTNNATELYMTTFAILGGTSLFDENMQPRLDDESIQDTLKFYTDLAQYCPDGITSYGYGEQISAFLSGKVAMTIYQGRVIARVANEAPDLIGKYAIVPIPTGNGLTTEDVQVGNMYNYFAIGAGCENPELAMAFLEYLCTGDNAVAWAMSAPGHITPALQSVRNALDEYLNTSDEEIVKTSADYIKFSYDHSSSECSIYEVNNAGCAYHGEIQRTGVFNKNYAYIRSYNVCSNMVQEVLINGSDISDVCTNAQEELVEIIADGV